MSNQSNQHEILYIYMYIINPIIAVQRHGHSFVVTLRLRGCKEENHPQDHGHEGSQGPGVPWFDSNPQRVMIYSAFSWVRDMGMDQYLYIPFLVG